VDYDLVIMAGDQPLDRMNDNVDVEVRLSDGSRWSSTFFTINNVKALFAKNRATDECANGLYLWASDMILVERLDESVIRMTIDDLTLSGEFHAAFSSSEASFPRSVSCASVRECHPRTVDPPMTREPE
jgi:hypothetical protein